MVLEKEMNQFRVLQEEIWESLHTVPGTLEELISRDFLLNLSVEGIERMLMSMENRNWIFIRNGIYYAKRRK